VLGFTLGLALVTGLLFGLLPALHASKSDLQSSLREGGRGHAGSGRARLARDLLVLGEVAAALVLLVGAGLLVRTFVGLQGVSPGFDPDGVMTLRISLPETTYPDDASQVAFYQRLSERLKAVPGVEASGTGFPLPLGGSDYVLSFAVQGRPAPPPNQSPESWMRFVTPGYLQAMGIPLIRGRGFADTDRVGAPRVALVNRTLAEAIFPGEDPIGHRITFNDPESPDAEWVEIVGVVGSVRDESLAKEPNGETYLCAFQSPQDVATIVAKTSGDPAALTGALRAAVHDVDPDLPVYRVRTLKSVVADSLSDQRFNATLFSIFAALALILASVGVYGVITYSVSQRTSEMGLRLALGAERREVLALVVRQAMARVAIGVAVGLAGALAAGRFLRSLVVGVPVRDPLTFGGVALVLLAVALLATWLPARRATRVDPVVALRSE
jgi:putative ABC transport system permease protein